MCLRLLTVLRAGPWDNTAIAFAAMLWNELASPQPLFVSALFMIVQVATERAGEHSRLTAPSCSRFGSWQDISRRRSRKSRQQRQAFDQQLQQHSPWFSRITQAIVTDAVTSLLVNDGQIHSEVGVLAAPEGSLWHSTLRHAPCGHSRTAT